jgi:2-oxoglutarate/2-oxoacid ferredoxin oxidoreductase subunit alpha
VFLASYPITPASDVLHELSKHKNFGVRTFQAEDEIAAAGAAVGAAFGGHLGVTTTSGPGMDLKAETMGLAVSLELPMLVIDIQRGGPSTGLPTKTEQSDLLAAMYGRHGEAPVPVVATMGPAHCFEAVIEAARIAVKYRTPVIVLSDTYLANSSEPWRLPDVADLPDISVPFTTEANHDSEFWPYLRDPDTLARPWAVPGTPGLQHRIGGLEKADRTGNISYDPANHDFMVRTRQAKVDGIAATIPATEVDDPDGDARVAVIGWGSTYGPIGAACRRIRASGRPIAQLHLRHLNPLPADLGDILARYDRVVCPEMNLGQLAMILRARYLIDIASHTQVRGLPFRAAELAAVLQDAIDGTPAGTTHESPDHTDTTILDTPHTPAAQTGAAL